MIFVFVIAQNVFFVIAQNVLNKDCFKIYLVFLSFPLNVTDDRRCRAQKIRCQNLKRDNSKTPRHRKTVVHILQYKSICYLYVVFNKEINKQQVYFKDKRQYMYARVLNNLKILNFYFISDPLKVYFVGFVIRMR
jgi:hypothetical protein